MPSDVSEKVPSLTEVLREVSWMKNVVTEAVEDGVKTALETARKSQASVQNAIEETRLQVKRSPFEAIGIVFLAGLLTGSCLTWLRCRRR